MTTTTTPSPHDNIAGLWGSALTQNPVSCVFKAEPHMASDSIKPNDLYFYDVLSRDITTKEFEHACTLLLSQFQGIPRSILKRSTYWSFEEDKKDMEEAYHDAILWLINKIRNGDGPGPSSIKNRLYTVTKGRFLDIKKKTRRGRERIADLALQYDVHVDQILDHERQKEHDELWQAVTDAIARLSQKCSHILQRFYMDKQPLKKIAEELGIGEGAARNRSMACKQQLRKLLTNFF